MIRKTDSDLEKKIEYKAQKNTIFKLDFLSVFDEVPINVFGNKFGHITLDKSYMFYSPNLDFVGSDEIIVEFSDNSIVKVCIDVVSTFKPKAHILILLGEELIKSSVMAIYELVKNSYDADSKEVVVDFKNIEDLNNAFITITDSGTGITKEVLEEVWFEPGSDFRKPIDSNGIRQVKRSPIFWRVPMGEKGVGRFAVHKLGNTIQLVSRPAKVVKDELGKAISVELLDYEVKVKIDWRAYSQSKYLEDVKINWELNKNPETFRFKDSHGTEIIIGNLKEPWNRGMARQLKRQTISMLSPKNDSNKFDIKLNFGNWWLNDFPSIEEVLKEAPYKLSTLLEDNFDMTFEYTFELTNNNVIGKRIIDDKSNNLRDKEKYKRNIKSSFRRYYLDYLKEKEYNKEEIEELIRKYDDDSFKIPFGAFMIELSSYDLDTMSLRDYTNNMSYTRNVLKEHSGIKVFKHGLRVFDYGDPGNDWLGLDIKRVNNKQWFSNNQNIGYVFLDDEYSNKLIEKTNREGFINNESYEFLVLLISFILNEFKAERSSDRERWLKFNKKGSVNSLDLQLIAFKNLIENSDFSDEEKKVKMLNAAEDIEKRYSMDKETLLIPAGVGMTASFAMHEIEKLVPRMEETIKSIPFNLDKMRDEVNELRDYIEGIISIVKKGGAKSISIVENIEQAFKNYELRLELCNIKVQFEFESSVESVICDKRLFITMLMNLIDNSLYWIDTIYKEDKGIYIKTEELNGKVSVLLVDNGPGFKDDLEDVIRPFFSRKENGIGIGLYLVDTVMMKYGKLNIIYDSEFLEDRNVPIKYRGAAVELIFNNVLV